MTGSDWNLFEGEISFDYVQIRAADTTSMHFDKDFVIGRLWNGNITQYQRT